MTPDGTLSGTADGVPARGGREPIRVSVVLATLNERASLPELLDRIDRVAPPQRELLVVDDGSTDGTREYVRERAVGDPRLRLLEHAGKQTTLRAQCQGIEASRGEFVVIMDSDLQHPPELLPTMVRALENGAAVAVASRYAPGGSAGRRSAFRWALSRGAEVLTKVLLPAARGVSDPVSGYFGFRREIWSPFNPLYRGYKLLIFVLVMAEGQRVDEIPFRFTPRTEGASKVTGNLGFLRIFTTELVLARRLRGELRRKADLDRHTTPQRSPAVPPQ